MSDAAPTPLLLAEPPRRNRRIVATAAVSVAVHLLLLGLLLLPRAPTEQPVEPQPIAVDLVPPSEVSSAEPLVSSEAPSSEAPSSEAPSSVEPASSAEPPSFEAASSAPPEPSAAASEASSASAEVAPQVPPARPVVIPVGPSEASSAEGPDASAASSAEVSSAPDAASEELLTASGAASGEGIDRGATSSSSEEPQAADAPAPPGSLRASKQFYLASMLERPNMARMRDALKTLPREKRLAQTCNIEAIAQIGNAGRGFNPDVLIANAFATPVSSGTTYGTSNGAFRSGDSWHSVAYECTLSQALDAVTSFSFRIGSDVTATMQARLGGKR